MGHPSTMVALRRLQAVWSTLRENGSASRNPLPITPQRQFVPEQQPLAVSSARQTRRDLRSPQQKTYDTAAFALMERTLRRVKWRILTDPSLLGQRRPRSMSTPRRSSLPDGTQTAPETRLTDAPLELYGQPQRQLAQSSATLHGWERHVTPNCEHNAEHNNRFSP
jgi:hypothetical protein